MQGIPGSGRFLLVTVPAQKSYLSFTLSIIWKGAQIKNETLR